MLHIIASIYDPVGIISLVVVTFKILFQKIVQFKSSWSAVVPQEFQMEWVKLVEIIKAVQAFNIGQYYFGPLSLESVQRFSLHGFCDARDTVYAAVIYIVVEASEGQMIPSFMTFTKTKIAPTKKLLTSPPTPGVVCMSSSSQSG